MLNTKLEDWLALNQDEVVVIYYYTPKYTYYYYVYFEHVNSCITITKPSGTIPPI